MKIQTKFILTLLCATLVALVGGQILLQSFEARAQSKVSKESLDLPEKREELHASSIHDEIPLVELDARPRLANFSLLHPLPHLERPRGSAGPLVLQPLGSP
ncbi:MAG: hypothetical protein ABSF76_10360 [Opitutaceae bacterium]